VVQVGHDIGSYVSKIGRSVTAALPGGKYGESVSRRSLSLGMALRPAICAGLKDWTAAVTRKISIWKVRQPILHHLNCSFETMHMDALSPTAELPHNISTSRTHVCTVRITDRSSQVKNNRPVCLSDLKNLLKYFILAWPVVGRNSTVQATFSESDYFWMS
jgi:hypothetical protein